LRKRKHKEKKNNKEKRNNVHSWEKPDTPLEPNYNFVGRNEKVWCLVAKNL